jgi:hypothetical protein
MPTPLSGKPTFGAGRVIAVPNVTNPTPARALVPQSQSIDFKRKVESLFGEKQLAVAVGGGEMEVTGKVEFGKTNARIFADILFGVGSSTGSYLQADKEAGTVPGSSTYVITVANATNYLFDLGVINADTGVIYTRVASGSEVSGASYSVATSGVNKGKYTFAAGDANANILLSYAYSSSTIGETLSLTNQNQGLIGSFQAVHVLPWGTQQDMVVFNNCIAASSGLSAKKSGFGSTMLDYHASVDAYDKLGTMTFAEAA